MLQKIESIVETGRFKALKHKAPQFGQLTLVYGRNGYGKSTICAVIRSVTERNPTILEARRRLGAVQAQAAKIALTGGIAIEFSNGNWTAPLQSTFIFDQEYVRRNLHVGDVVTIENRRQLLPIVIGENGVKLIEKINALDEEQRKLSLEIEKIESAVCAANSAVKPKEVKALAEFTVPSDIDSKIEAAIRNVNRAQQVSFIKQKEDPVQIDVPDIRALQEILQRSLEHLSADAGQKIDAHIKKHHMESNGIRWLQYGVRHLHDEQCPFCNQSISSVQLVDVFKGYFSSEFDSLVADIEMQKRILEDMRGDDGLLLDAVFNRNSSDLQLWKNVCDIGDAPALSPEEQRAISNAIADLIGALQEKAKNPLQAIKLERLAEIEKGVDVLKQYQKGLESCIKIIRETRINSDSANLEAAQEALGKLKALKWKLDSANNKKIEEWIKLDRRRQEIPREKIEAQKSLREAAKAAVGSRQDTINELLEVFGATFRIEETKPTFVGREPNAEYSIAIGTHRVKAGDNKVGAPTFGTVLSSGDKSTLALAFFLTQVRSDTALADAIVVFDDPFNSMDIDRRWETTSQLRNIASTAKQVLIFSHDPYFLALIKKNSRTECSTYQLCCDDSGIASVKSWSPEEELEELYIRRSERIREFANTGNLLPAVTHESLIKDIRPFLEDFLKSRFPGRFEELDMLNAMIEAIELAGNSDPLHSHLQDLRALNEYTRDSMHGGSTAPGPGELRAQCRKVIRILGSY